MVDSHISDEMRAAVGTELEREVSFPVSESDIRRWAMAVYYPEPPPRLFWDREYAKNTRYGGIIAPEDFNPFAWMSAEKQSRRADGPLHDPGMLERMIGITPPAVKFQLNGGAEAEYGVPIRPNDVVTSTMRLGGYSEREGRLGLMLFTIREITWVNQDDELVKTTRRTLIRY